MSIPIPSVGTIQFTTFTPDTAAHALDGIKTALVAAGWTATAFQSSAQLTITVPANNATCVIAGVTYTFQTSLNNSVANNILIGGSPTLQAQYIADAVNHGSGGGTEWSSPTVANPVVTAVASGATLTLTSVGSGTGGSSSFSVTGFGNAISQGNGYVCQCAATPDGLQANAYLVNCDTSGSTITIWFGSADGSLQSATLIPGGGSGGASGTFGSIVITGGRTLKIRADAHSFYVYLAGSKSTQGTEVGMCVPSLRDGQAPLTVSNVNAAGGGQIQITTTNPHGLTSGQSVSEYGIIGVPANGVFTITVVNANTYYLNGTTFSGTYTSGGLVGGAGGVGAPGGISRCILAWFDYCNLNSGQSGHKNTWRNGLVWGSGWFCVNENSYGNIGNNNALGQAWTPQPASGGGTLNWGGGADSSEFAIGWPGTSSSGALRKVGLMWGALLVVDSIPMDDTITSYLGHNWANITDSSSLGSLYLATS